MAEDVIRWQAILERFVTLNGEFYTRLSLTLSPRRQQYNSTSCEPLISEAFLNNIAHCLQGYGQCPLSYCSYGQLCEMFNEVLLDSTTGEEKERSPGNEVRATLIR